MKDVVFEAVTAFRGSEESGMTAVSEQEMEMEMKRMKGEVSKEEDESPL